MRIIMRKLATLITLSILPFSLSAQNTNEPEGLLQEPREQVIITTGQADRLGKINVNTANAVELAATLNGVGIRKAEAIVNFRDQFGPFLALDELTAVKGIGSATVAKNAKNIIFD